MSGGRMTRPRPRKGGHGGARTPNIDSRDLKIKLYTPHEGQQKLHNSTARFRICCCGRRWGKSLACQNELVRYSWENPGSITWWVAPTYGQARKMFLSITENFEGAIAAKRSAQGQMEIKWKNGTRTRFVSAERYENLRGEGVNFMVIDEAAFVPRAAWFTVLRPMLSDTMGSAVLISTPKGKNWFYDMYRRGEDPEQKDYESFSFPTISSPYILDSEVEEAQQTLPQDVFLQEYSAAFLDEVAGVFHGVRECVQGDFYVPDLRTHKCVIGWDIAQHTDWSVFTVIDTDGLKEERTEAGEARLVPCPHVCHWERFNQVRYNVQMDNAAAIAEKFAAPILMDSTGLGDPIYDTLVARGVPVIPYHFSQRSKQALIQNLASTIQMERLTYPDITVLIDELQAFQYEIGPTGSIKYSAPEGMHDDCVMSLALAAWAAQHPIWQREPLISMVNEEQISPY